MKYAVIAVIALISLVGSSFSFAQEQDPDIEEIIVIGELTKSAVEEQIILVEEDVYRLFNANNSSDEFDIKCRSAVPTGTHFAQRVCEPTFLVKARQRNNSNFVLGLELRLPIESLQAELVEEFAQLNAEYAGLITNNEIFAEVVQILGLLQARLAQFDN